LAYLFRRLQQPQEEVRHERDLRRQVARELDAHPRGPGLGQEDLPQGQGGTKAGRKHLKKMKQIMTSPLRSYVASKLFAACGCVIETPATCHVISYHAMPCHAMPCHVMSCFGSLRELVCRSWLEKPAGNWDQMCARNTGFNRNTAQQRQHQPQHRAQPPNPMMTPRTIGMIMRVTARPTAPVAPKRAQMYVNSAYWLLCTQFTSSLCEAAARKCSRWNIISLTKDEVK